MRVSAEEVSAQVHTWLPGSVYYLGIRFVCIFSPNSSGTTDRPLHEYFSQLHGSPHDFDYCAVRVEAVRE